MKGERRIARHGQRHEVASELDACVHARAGRSKTSDSATSSTSKLPYECDGATEFEGVVVRTHSRWRGPRPCRRPVRDTRHARRACSRAAAPPPPRGALICRARSEPCAPSCRSRIETRDVRLEWSSTAAARTSGFLLPLARAHFQRNAAQHEHVAGPRTARRCKRSARTSATWGKTAGSRDGTR